MIPPLVMDLQPGMTVLDMCAAPGSKAAQLLEMVHRGEEARIRQSIQDHATEDGREMRPDGGKKLWDEGELELDSSDAGRATGLLIANDSDYKRAHMLIHQLKRLSSPNLIVTNHDATMYPSIKLPPTPENPALNRYLKFDRILADVPCSGDGTTRKNVNLWKDWTPGSALGLYITQVRILVRALQMLKAGGRVVYSTCSMNPVENEAVIASAIERCGGLEKVRLVPSDDKLPLLKRKPGLKNWSVMDKTGEVYDSFEDVQKDIAENGSSPALEKLVEGMFPPSFPPGSEEIPFERCMRVYAHQQDTGGFFIAILEKQIEFKAKPESESKKIEPKPPISSLIDDVNNGIKRKAEDSDEPSPKKIRTERDDADMGDEKDPVLDAISSDAHLGVKDGVDSTGEEQKVHFPTPPGEQLDQSTRPGDMRSDLGAQPRPMNRNRNGQQFEEPYKYIAGDHPEVRTVESFYHLSPRFPRDRFMVRNASGEPVKTIYYTSALVRDLLTENEGKGIKFVHGGVKMFMKQDVQGEGVCKWRIQSEGMPILEGYVGEERVVRLYKKETLRKLLIEMFPKLADGAWKNLDEIGERVNNIPMGCCVLRIEPSNEPDGFEERIVLPLWRSLHSLNLMLAKEDRTAMLLRIYNDTTPLVNNQKQGNKVKSEEKQEVASGFKREDGEIKVDVNHSIEAAKPEPDTEDEGSEIRPGPYETLVADSNSAAAVNDVKMEKIIKDEDTGGPEQQLNGTGGVEGQLSGVS